jgi:hypothetical protein
VKVYVRDLALNEKLANGATAIAFRNLRAGHLGVVLAVWGTEYVTWIVNFSSDGPPTTGHGHYFDDLREAVNDFYERT